jgi:hypothetical protein
MCFLTSWSCARLVTAGGRATFVYVEVPRNITILERKTRSFFGSEGSI